ncbi:alpha-ketoglutarate-dependent dioxygenase AlkB [Acidovorax sp. DW039]|uniref:alpha-ketoglutarate-dependent dioxygenase AlkB family protein n=1 Tax=Acidovorax sp. DW039 TaxID=3095606 RepID=UPI00308AC23C|nr:alpha-ketoglutarate-dependent dioxygenase AlkB [Acidovorax sp. DW039]
MDADLFGAPPEGCINVLDDGLDISYWPDFLKEHQANHFLDKLLTETDWRQPEIWMFGRLVKTPRLTAWHGDEKATYKYSGIVNQPMAWTPSLLELRDMVEATTSKKYNSVLLNLYRNGSDHLSWHSDDELELGPDPTISSLSLGASRTFCLRSKISPTHQKRKEITLPNGSLLCMRGLTQAQWEHSIKKEPKIINARINLTFRLINII